MLRRRKALRLERLRRENDIAQAKLLYNDASDLSSTYEVTMNNGDRYTFRVPTRIPGESLPERIAVLKRAMTIGGVPKESVARWFAKFEK